MPPALKGAMLDTLPWTQQISIILSLFRKDCWENGWTAVVKKPEGSRLFQPSSVRLVFYVETTLDVLIDDMWQSWAEDGSSNLVFLYLLMAFKIIDHGIFGGTSSGCWEMWVPSCPGSLPSFRTSSSWFQWGRARQPALWIATEFSHHSFLIECLCKTSGSSHLPVCASISSACEFG